MKNLHTNMSQNTGRSYFFYFDGKGVQLQIGLSVLDAQQAFLQEEVHRVVMDTHLLKKILSIQM